jgi:hypothetical protein
VTDAWGGRGEGESEAKGGEADDETGSLASFTVGEDIRGRALVAFLVAWVKHDRALSDLSRSSRPCLMSAGEGEGEGEGGDEEEGEAEDEEEMEEEEGEEQEQEERPEDGNGPEGTDGCRYFGT